MTGSRDAAYVGPRPFQIGEGEWFFGRATETEIVSNLTSSRVVLLFAPSGAGKSSLLRAGVEPDLTRPRVKRRGRRTRTYQKMRMLPVLKVGGGKPRGLTRKIDNIFVYSAVSQLVEPDDPDAIAETTLVEALQRFFDDEEEKAQTAPPSLLVIDQFEEIFTFHLERWRDREGFFKQVTAALDAYPTLHVLFSMREDYIAELTPFARLLPGELRVRFRLDRLGPAAAIDAVKKPAERGGAPFEPGAAERLVEQLRRTGPAHEGEEEETLAAYVEPVQLQIVCQQLWTNLPPDATSITAEHVRKYGDVTRALADFYEDTLREVCATGVVKERALRDWFETKIITPAETRGLVYRGEEETEGLPNAVVDALEEHWIIRRDKRGSDVWIELTHDRLVEPILKANARWRERNANPVTAPAEAWLAGQRDDERLISGTQLRVLEAFAASYPDALAEAEAEFLKRSREQADRLAAEAQRLAEQAAHRARLRRGAMVIAALVFVVVSVLYVRAEQAREAAEVAQAQADEQAENARTEAAIGWAVAKGERDPTIAALFLKAAPDPTNVNWIYAYRSLFQHPLASRLVDLGAPVVDGAWHPSRDAFAVATARSLRVYGEGAREWATSRDVSQVTWSPDGEWLATIEGGAVHLRAGESERTFGELVERIWFLDGDRVLTVGKDPASKKRRKFGHFQIWRLGGDGAAETTTVDIGGRAFSTALQGETFAVTVDQGKDCSRRAGFKDAKKEDCFEVQVFDLKPNTPARIARLQLPKAIARYEIKSVAISPDAQSLAFASGNFVYYWRTLPRDDEIYSATRTEVDADHPADAGAVRLRGDSWVYRVAWSPDGRRLVGVTDYGVAVWRRDGVVERRFEARESSRKLIWQKDGARLATVGRDGAIAVRYADGAPLTVLKHPGVVARAVFDPAGERVLSVGDDGSARVWRLDQVPLSLSHGDAEVIHAEWRPDGGELLTNTGEALRLWPLRGHQTPGSIIIEGSRHLWHAAFAPDGRRLAVGMGDPEYPKSNALSVWSRTDERDEARPTEWTRSVRVPRASKVHHVAWSPDGCLVAAGDHAGRTLVLDGDRVLLDAAPPAMKLNDTVYIRHVAWRPQRGAPAACPEPGERAPYRLLSSATDKHARVYGDSKGAWGEAPLQESIYLGKWAQSGSWRPQSDLVATPSHKRTVVWDPQTGDVKAKLKGTTLNRRAEWDSTGAHIAVLATGSLAFWDQTQIEAAAGAAIEPKRTQPHQHGSSNLAWNLDWHPTLPLVASGSTDRALRVWNADGELKLEIEHEFQVNSAAWSPDGNSLAVGDSGGHALVFRIPPLSLEDPVAYLNQQVDGCLSVPLRMRYLHETEEEAREACAQRDVP